MQALLEANQEETMQMLESTYMMYVRKNSQQSLQLNEKRQEAEKLLSSVQTVFQRVESVNFMKVQLSSSVSSPLTLTYIWTNAVKGCFQDMQTDLPSFSEHKTVPAADGQVSLSSYLPLFEVNNFKKKIIFIFWII